MLRAVIREKMKCQYSGAEYERMYTIDFDCQELEAGLSAGGLSEGGYHVPQLVGIEVFTPPAEKTPPA